MAVGRISGPLLKANLLREGVDLAFETDLLYLDVTDRRIGINSDDPQYNLDVNGTARVTDLDVDTQFNIGEITISNNDIVSTNNTISFAPSGLEPTVYHSRFIVNDIELNGNVISTTVSNSDLELRPSGTGIVDIQSSANVDGDLTVTGNIDVTGNVTISGNIIIGDEITDSIEINASINSDLIPEEDNTYSLGSNSFKWQNVYANDLFADTLNLNTFTVGNIQFQNNEITTTTGDLNFEANGTGSINLGNFEIVDNTITNAVEDSISVLSQSGDGYFKIDGTNGFVPPVGNSGNRPTSYAVIGMTRYNTDSGALEIWDGISWASPAGTTGAVSEVQANDIAIRFALTVG